MNPDSISSYQRDPSTSSLYQDRGATKAYAAGKNLPKDVLEALEKGNLDEALVLLKAHNATEEQMNIFYQLLGKIGKGLKLLAKSPSAMIAHMLQKKNRKKDPLREINQQEQNKSIEKAQEQEKAILKYLAKLQELAQLFASLSKKCGTNVKTGINKGSRALTSITKKIKENIEPSYTKLRARLQKIFSHLNLFGKLASNKLGKLLEKIEVRLLGLKNRSIRLKEKGKASIEKLTKPVKEWAENHLQPHLEKLKKWVSYTLEIQTQKIIHVAEQVWHGITFIGTPIVAVFQQFSKWSTEVTEYGIAHLTKAFKKANAWLQDRATAAYQQFVDIVLPPLRKFNHWASHHFTRLLNFILKILLWIWLKVVKVLEKIPVLLSKIGKAIWIFLKMFPALCFAALLGFSRGISNALARSLKL